MGNPIFGAASFITPRIDDPEQRLAFKAAAILATGLGLSGTDWVTDAVAHTGDFWCFHAVTDCVIAAVTYAPGTSTGSPAGVTLKAGDRIYGNIKSLTLTSGTGELYRASITV